MKSRFCPSPTGYMHLGNARTALFNALLAQSLQGQFLLRIEDSDKIRSEEHFDAILQADLLWLGLPWQEGPQVGGSAAPYWQSQRGAVYEKYYQQLEQSQRVYPCFCTEQQLAIARKVQLASGQPPRYAGTCRHLSAEQIADKKSQDLLPTLRFLVPEQQKIEFVDLVRGLQTFNSSDIGDFIIRRADGTASFMFCNAIDDAVMGVTHALRGEDHLTNTPRQLLILQALNLPAPQYGHISLIMSMDGSKLSKREGSRSISELREQGFFPEALINYMARLGHYYQQPGYMNFAELAANFSTDALSSAPARYDLTQLLHWQKEAVAHATADTLWKWMGAAVHAIVPVAQRDHFIETIRHNVSFPPEASFWAHTLFGDEIIYTPDDLPILKKTGADFFRTAIQLLDQYGADYGQITQGLQQQLNVKGKALFQPLRIALTGSVHGPEMARVLQLLGQHKIHARLQHAAEQSGK